MKQKIRQDLKRVIAIAVFFCMLLWIVGELGVLVRPFDEDFDKWHYFYAEDKDTLNVAAIGSSSIYRYWIPTRAYEKYGFTSFMIAQSGQDIHTVPYIMEEAVKSQKVDLFIVETRQLVTYRTSEYKEKTDKEKQQYLFSTISAGMKPSFVRMRMIHDILQKDAGNPEIEWQIPLLKYHDNLLNGTWTEWKKRLTSGRDIYKSATQISKVEKQSETKIEPDGTLVLLEEDHQIIDEIVRTAEKLNTKILFIATPYIATKYRYPLQLQLDAYMEKKGYPYLNLNAEKKEIGLDLSTDFYNLYHTNIAGANKVTDYLAEYLSTHYRFENKLNSTQKKDWDASVVAWKEKEAELLAQWEENCKEQE